MPKLVAFNSVTLDGYFSGPNTDITWAHKDRQDPEWNSFVIDNAGIGATLLFGRITYQLMASYWPTNFAKQRDPIVSERMNSVPKIVFSRTLSEATWMNTRLVKDDMVAAVRQMKQESGSDMAILGSGTIVKQLTEEGLIDEYQFVVNAVALGQGRTLFEGIKNKLSLKLASTRIFQNGNVYLIYEKELR